MKGHPLREKEFNISVYGGSLSFHGMCSVSGLINLWAAWVTKE